MQNAFSHGPHCPFLSGCRNIPVVAPVFEVARDTPRGAPRDGPRDDLWNAERSRVEPCRVEPSPSLGRLEPKRASQGD